MGNWLKGQLEEFVNTLTCVSSGADNLEGRQMTYQCTSWGVGDLTSRTCDVNVWYYEIL